jgi:uncharacterized membrane protein
MPTWMWFGNTSFNEEETKAVDLISRLERFKRNPHKTDLPVERPLKYTAPRCSIKGLLMITELPITTIAHAIQLAVAPVFLLTGVASILSVLTNRLGRIIDRSRLLHGKSVSVVGTDQTTLVELKSLKKRARLIHLAIGLCTACLLLICSFITFSIEMVIAALFVAAMLCLIVALVYFICEIFLATAHVRGEP